MLEPGRTSAWPSRSFAQVLYKSGLSRVCGEWRFPLKKMEFQSLHGSLGC